MSDESMFSLQIAVLFGGKMLDHTRFMVVMPNISDEGKRLIANELRAAADRICENESEYWKGLRRDARAAGVRVLPALRREPWREGHYVARPEDLTPELLDDVQTAVKFLLDDCDAADGALIKKEYERMFKEKYGHYPCEHGNEIMVDDPA